MDSRSSDPDPDTSPLPEAPGHYFSSTPDAESSPSTVRLDLPDRSMTLATDRGVFSPGRIDPGTKLLLLELLEQPDLADGTVVDLGCGYGPIACTVAARQPHLKVIAVDVNERARQLCEANSRALGLDIEVLSPQEAGGIAEIAAIVSNPPVRIGKQAMRELLGSWLARLRTDGHAYLVINKNLGADSHASWLVENGYDVERLRSRQGYRILDVTRLS